ncbi:hypothetical protein GCM10011360_22880 [Primorskyibacter flagellatus]|uniref:TIGR02453 family protein n=1 Tax=Primorskyibacter flagellatus TaxID=1387277 RepID=A0A917A860_9RHOB|nr:DUF2461 domain-containing protein [Primorskyibacter flagellatus]GGE34441.1 hypothetical protein GCM10011360_22880 [Primorskyibacter flagellatus]
MSAFDTLIPDAQDFCRRLAADNTAEFYKAHKEDYLSRLKRPAELLLDSLAPRIAEVTGGTVTTKLFRINRDLRFAKGQPPYKDYLHMLWYSPADGPAPMGWFFGIETDRVRVGAGYMGFDGPALTRWREVMAGPEGAGIAAGIETQLAAGAEMRDAALKRVPSPYPQDHPQAAFLKRKGMGLFRTMPAPAADLPGALLAEYAGLWPAFATLTRAMSR